MRNVEKPLRYIGSKANLLSNIANAVNDRSPGEGYFCDIFAGTGVVGQTFKTNFPVISNDFLYFSYVIQKSTIGLNEPPKFKELKSICSNPFDFLNQLNSEHFEFTCDPFVALNFSPYGSGERKYFSAQNALHIDAIRQTLDVWKSEKNISEDEYYYLLASLIVEVPSISNIAGTYGAFLKHWDPRTKKPIKITPSITVNNRKENLVFNENANDLIKKVSGEILYMDPPYNGRQYLGNYHLLETIAKYDYPVLSGKTGMRSDISKSSDFCKKGKVAKAFEDILENSNFKYIFISYNTEGLLEIDQLVSLVESKSIASKLKIYKIPYRRYSRLKAQVDSELHEYIISAVK